jgi:hypothetical protein
MDLRRVFGFVRKDVMKATGNKQKPYVYGTHRGDNVPLVPGPPKEAVAAARQPARALATCRNSVRL